MISNASDGKSLEYRKKVKEETPERPPKSENHGDLDQPAQPPVSSFNVEVTVLLKYLSNFWRTLGLPLMSREVELHF